MNDLLTKIILFFNRKRMIKDTKYLMVYYYIIFDGDHESIKKAFSENYGIFNEERINEVLKNINLDDYSMIIEKDFDKYCPKRDKWVVKKEVECE